MKLEWLMWHGRKLRKGSGLLIVTTEMWERLQKKVGRLEKQLAAARQRKAKAK